MNLILKTTTFTLAATTLLCGGALFLKRGNTMPSTQNVAFLPTADGVRAPEFPANLSWFNTDKPLSIKGLRGKIVLLDFWTYGCINCIHIIPDLKKLEAKYGKELVVIGVHSAKFETESKPENLRQAVMRYGLEHPVVSDKGMRIWSEYAVRAWPTQVLIDPNGRVVGQVAGEGNYDVLDRTIAKVAKESRANKTLNETPLKIALERSKVAPTPLYFPGKVRAANGSIFISDSSHNRIVVTDQNGQVQQVIGNGESALKDGDFASASFSNPQGLSVDGEKIYVADTNNHAIREIDLSTKTVKTIAGTGKQAAWMSKGGTGTQAALSSPWDVLKNGNTVYIAMAGPHQIWKMELPSREVSVFAGSGRESRVDGSRADATFAQPSGLATNGRELFVADSESSAIRAISLGETSEVKTLAGGDLFDFGDVDAQGLKARLQHPLGVEINAFDAKDKNLYFVDTYNSKVKRIDESGNVSTVYAGGLDEPGGLSFVDEDTLLIADTNGHSIKKLDLKTKKLSTLVLRGLSAPVLNQNAPAPQVVDEKTTAILAANTPISLVFNAKIPAKFHLNAAAPNKVEVKVSGAGLKTVKSKVSGAQMLPANLTFQSGASGKGTIEMTAWISYCNEGDGAVCKVESIKKRLPFEVRAGGAKEVKLGVILR